MVALRGPLLQALEIITDNQGNVGKLLPHVEEIFSIEHSLIQIRIVKPDSYGVYL